MKFIVLHLDKKEAKKLHRLLGSICTDKELADIWTRLDLEMRPKNKAKFTVDTQQGPS